MPKNTQIYRIKIKKKFRWQKKTEIFNHGFNMLLLCELRE